MEKKKYVAPEYEAVRFSSNDVLTALSGHSVHCFYNESGSWGYEGCTEQSFTHWSD